MGLLRGTARARARGRIRHLACARRSHGGLAPLDRGGDARRERQLAQLDHDLGRQGGAPSARGSGNSGCRQSGPCERRSGGTGARRSTRRDRLRAQSHRKRSRRRHRHPARGRSRRRLLGRDRGGSQDESPRERDGQHPSSQLRRSAVGRFPRVASVPPAGAAGVATDHARSPFQRSAALVGERGGLFVVERHHSRRRPCCDLVVRTAIHPLRFRAADVRHEPLVCGVLRDQPAASGRFEPPHFRERPPASPAESCCRSTRAG